MKNFFSDVLDLSCLPSVFSIMIFVFLGLSNPAFSAQVELALGAPAGARPAGYKIYYGISGGKYTKSINVGYCNAYSVSGLEENNTYYFAATSYDSAGTESVYSNEVSKFIPASDADASELSQLKFSFDSTAEGFIYQDGLFRGTMQSAYASGSYDTGKGLSVILGGIDGSWILDGRSGGWTKTFEVFDAGTVTISIGYRLTIAGEYESDEYSQVLVSLDGNLIGTAGKDYLLELRGTDVNTPLIDSGWRTATLQTTLSQGVHTLAIGVWNNKKTGALETTQAYFDDIVISQARPVMDEDNDGFTASQGDCNDFDDLTYPVRRSFAETASIRTATDMTCYVIRTLTMMETDSRKMKATSMMRI